MSDMPFQYIPESLRTPGFFAEFDGSGANAARAPQKGLIIGQMRNSGSRCVTVATSAVTTADASIATITFTNAAAIQNVRPGMVAIDRTAGTAITNGSKVVSKSGGVVTMDAAIANNIGSGDSIEFYDLTPTLLNSAVSPSLLFGAGSQLARMATKWLQRNNAGEVWLLPLPDDPAATAASGTVLYNAAATANGTHYLMIGGIEVPVAITSSMTVNQVATAVAAAITANKDLAATASASTATVTITAKHKGAAGNAIDIRTNYYGTIAGEIDPTGLVYTITAMSGGATNPSTALTAALATLPPYHWGYVATPFGTDSTCLNVQQTWMSDATGQWAWSSMAYGHVFAAQANTLATLQTNGAARNDQHGSIMGFYDSPTPPEEWSAVIAAGVQQRLDADQGANLDGLALPGILPPAPTSTGRFSPTSRNTLLWSGISTFKVAGGQVLVDKLITTYQLNAYSSPDDSYLDPETLYRVAYALTSMRSEAETRFAGARLAADNTRFNGALKIVTPTLFKAFLIAQHRDLEDQGIVQDTDGFAKAVQVEIDGQNKRRINALMPFMLVNDLDVMATIAQLRK